MNAKLVCLNTGAINQESGVPEVEAVDLLADGDGANLPENRTPLGKVPMYQALGVSSMPYAPDSDNTSWAEGVVIRNVGGWNMVCVGARDHRCAKIYGNLQPGDTVIHCTGPDPAPQVLLKREKRQAVVATKGSDGKQMLLQLDGKNDQVMISAFGLAFKLAYNDGKPQISCCSANGKNGITIGDECGHLFGTWVGGGMAAIPGMSLAVAPSAAWAAIGATPVGGFAIGL